MCLLRNFVVVSVSVWGLLSPALAQGERDSFNLYREALDRAAIEIAAVLSKRNASVATASVIPMTAEEGIKVACEPLSGHLTKRFRESLSAYIEKFGIGIRILAETRLSDPTQVAVSGTWTPVGHGEIQLHVEVGRVIQGEFERLGEKNVSFDELSLPPILARCILEYETYEQDLPSNRHFRVRSGPFPTAEKIPLAAGITLATIARIKGLPWWVVEWGLEHRGALFNRRGFVYAHIEKDSISDLRERIKQSSQKIEEKKRLSDEISGQIRNLDSDIKDQETTVSRVNSELKSIRKGLEYARGMKRHHEDRGDPVPPQIQLMYNAAVEAVRTAKVTDDRETEELQKMRGDRQTIQERNATIESELQATRSKQTELEQELTLEPKRVVDGIAEQPRVIVARGRAECTPDESLTACRDRALGNAEDKATEYGKGLIVAISKTVPNLGLSESNVRSRISPFIKHVDVTSEGWNDRWGGRSQTTYVVLARVHFFGRKPKKIKNPVDKHSPKFWVAYYPRLDERGGGVITGTMDNRGRLIARFIRQSKGRRMVIPWGEWGDTSLVTDWRAPTPEDSRENVSVVFPDGSIGRGKFAKPRRFRYDANAPRYSTTSNGTVLRGCTGYDSRKSGMSGVFICQK